MDEPFDMSTRTTMKNLLLLLVWTPVGLASSGEEKRTSAGTMAPVLVQRIEPEYTAEARAMGIQGVTTLYAEVSSDGSAHNIRVIKSLDPGLDRNAIAAVTQWRFQPGTRNGKTATVSATIEVRFGIRKFSTAASEKPKAEKTLADEQRAMADEDGLNDDDPCQTLLQLLKIAPAN